MYEKYVKRLIDIIIGIIGLPFFIIIFIIMAPIILLTDGRPIFYLGERLGKNGSVFRMYKFRSMRNNAPDIRMEDGSTYNSEDDPRVTTIGKFMRKTSIDETPQILNVILGNMSVIGPRPFVPDGELKYDNKNFMDRLRVRPGVTGYTQAYYRNSISQDEKMKYDADYANNVTFIGDIKIFLKTIISVLRRENIYSDIKESIDDEK